MTYAGRNCNLGIFQDVTKRKEEDKKFRSFIEELPGLVLIYQCYKCLYANPAAEQITGYTKEELLSMKFSDLLTPDYKDMAFKGGKMLEEKGLLALDQAVIQITTKKGDESG
ncbi:MAG: PAS domain S-box protein [Candidatus Hodarchaeota archaeon]